MILYSEKVKAMLAQNDKIVKIIKVPWKENTQVGFLSKLANANQTDLHIYVWIEVLDRPSMEESSATTFLIIGANDWRTLIKEYLLTGTVPSDRLEVIKLTNRA